MYACVCVLRWEHSVQGRALGNLAQLLKGKEVVVRLFRLSLQLRHEPGQHTHIAQQYARNRPRPCVSHRLLCADLLMPVPASPRAREPRGGETIRGRRQGRTVLRPALIVDKARLVLVRLLQALAPAPSMPPSQSASAATQWMHEAGHSGRGHTHISSTTSWASWTVTVSRSSMRARASARRTMASSCRVVIGVVSTVRCCPRSSR
jgi:hypothetical protein